MGAVTVVTCRGRDGGGGGGGYSGKDGRDSSFHSSKAGRSSRSKSLSCYDSDYRSPQKATVRLSDTRHFGDILGGLKEEDTQKYEV